MSYQHFDMSEDVRGEVFSSLGSKYDIAAENVDFIPPIDGSPWLKFDYMEASTDAIDLSRRCRVFIGLVQIGVIFSPGSGVTTARAIAKEVAEIFYDGKIIGQSYIYTAGEVMQVQKQENGWLIPVRFSVRHEHKEEI